MVELTRWRLLGDYCAGDVIRWQGCPVVILGPPKSEKDARCRTVAYLSTDRPGSQLISVAPGDVLGAFCIDGKEPWTGDLTSEETALWGKLMLTEAR